MDKNTDDGKTIENSKHPFNLLILLSFILFLSTKILTYFPKDWLAGGLYSWVYTDWLIDYSAGFVRRGLAGELLSAASNSIHPYHFAVILSWGVFLILVIGYLYLVLQNIKKIPPLYLIIILFLPSLLLFYMFDHSALGRKEMLGYPFLFMHLFLIKQQFNMSPTNKNSYVKFLPVITWLFLPLHILIHEASLFLFIPIHIMMSWTVLSYNENHHFYKKLSGLALMYSPVFITFLIVSALGRPELDVVQKICTHWEALHAINQGACQIGNPNTMWTLPGAFTALAWNFSQATSLTASLSTRVILIWLLIFLLFSFISIAYLGKLSTLLSVDEDGQQPVEQTSQWKHSTLIRFKYFLIPLLCSLPLYILGWDWGRWFAVISINFAIIALSKELGYMEAKTLPINNSFFNWLTRITNTLTTSRIKISHVTLSVFLLIILFYIRLPHCCISDNNFEFIAEPLKEILQFMAK